MPIKFEKVSHIYSEGTPFRYVALEDVDLEFREGAFTAVIGRTGSGKSTLVQHLNALLLPTSGTVIVDDWELKAGQDAKGLKKLRKKVGLVFQFPEYQLFEETVLKDVSFGPKNFGVSVKEAEEKASNALRMVGLEKEYEQRSPLELSGGQKRRVAIAGILAMDPDILVLDEPTAGLDPQGALEMMRLFRDLNKIHGTTIIMVTHDMEQAAGTDPDERYAEREGICAHRRYSYTSRICSCDRKAGETSWVILHLDAISRWTLRFTEWIPEPKSGQ